MQDKFNSLCRERLLRALCVRGDEMTDSLIASSAAQAESLVVAMHPGCFVIANEASDATGSRDHYDVLVWAAEADSIDDDGARAIARYRVERIYPRALSSRDAYDLGAPAHDCDAIPDSCQVASCSGGPIRDDLTGYACGHTYADACAVDPSYRYSRAVEKALRYLGSHEVTPGTYAFPKHLRDTPLSREKTTWWITDDPVQARYSTEIYRRAHSDYVMALRAGDEKECQYTMRVLAQAECDLRSIGSPVVKVRAAACDCAADALGAFCDRLMALRREHEEFAPGDEIAALPSNARSAT